MSSSSIPEASAIDKTAEQLGAVQLDQDGKPLSKNALKKLEKEREKAKKKVRSWIEECLFIRITHHLVFI